MRTPLKIRNPLTGDIDFQIVPAADDAIRAAAHQLRGAQQDWAMADFEDRLEVLTSFAEVLRQRRLPLLEALIQDTGRRAMSIIELDGLAPAIQRWGSLARALRREERSSGESSLPGVTYRQQRVPLGLVGVISPWNFPLTLSLIDALPALLAGNAVLLKPSEITPRFATPLRDILAEVPALNAVITIIDGDATTGADLIQHVDAICFTGSVRTGRKVAVSAARQFIPAFLELGGNDPAIVLEDADVERASTALLRASVLNTGQACQSIERIYVAETLFDDVLQRLIDKAQAVRLSRDHPEDGHLGPLIHAPQGGVIDGQLQDAVRLGARIHTGGPVERDGGIWCRPTVVSQVNHRMRLMQEETFGPVMPVMPFATDSEAIALANDTVFGLSAAVFSSEREHAESVARRIDAGAISLNDASLTGLVHEAEKNSFGLSGLGGSRMGAAGYLRFFRTKALLWNGGSVACIDQFDESRGSAGPDATPPIPSESSDDQPACRPQP